ncbi:hypothetical protein LAZ67_12000318 [Cordylochernes scorpioides]|uniref:Mos1 transposase HTH domain-containing protein n=1 Tax=Cordylochernes scorpioides TaxID=51811 RepID=A0ABY6L355_9ARAC|nr:hypothetical protein LAZ67_12000318 [Cordylochernes scorpioides]
MAGPVLAPKKRTSPAEAYLEEHRAELQEELGDGAKEADLRKLANQKLKEMSAQDKQVRCIPPPGGKSLTLFHTEQKYKGRSSAAAATKRKLDSAPSAGKKAKLGGTTSAKLSISITFFILSTNFVIPVLYHSPAASLSHLSTSSFTSSYNSTVEIHRQLVEVYGEKCMDIKNVQKWCREFNKGRINVHDEQRSGRPSLPESTVARIDEMVRANRRITLEDIEDGLNEDCSHFSKNTLGDRNDEVKEEVDKWLKKAVGEWYNTGITKLVDRMKKVIEHQGDYVEK